MFSHLLDTYLLLPDYSLIGSESGHIHQPTGRTSKVYTQLTQGIDPMLFYDDASLSGFLYD